MVFGILLALGIFIYMAMKGFSIVLASILCATIVIVTNNLPFDIAMLEYFALGPLGAFSFAGKFFLLFAAGAMFGRTLSSSGAATAIANKLVESLGTNRVLVITVLFSALLTYGGVVVFVVIFTMYPLGIQLLHSANVPKRLFTSALALGIGTFTMTAMPGSPSIHNVISSVSLQTDLFAAASYGLFGSAIMLSLGLWYLEKHRKLAQLNNEGFEPSAKDKAIIANASKMNLPSWQKATLPLLFVAGTILTPRLLLMAGIDNNVLINYANTQPIIWPCIALFIGCIVTMILFPSILKNALRELGNGAEDSITPLIATSVVIGFGGVVSNTAAFTEFSQWLTSLDIPPLISVFLSASAVSGIVGSSSGGLQIFMSTMAPSYLEQGVNPDILHRIAAMASGGFDSLPHCGGIVAVLAITGQTHKSAYKDIAVVTVVFPVIATLACIALYMALV